MYILIEVRSYGIKDILGIKHGYLGLTKKGTTPLELTAESVARIHEFGGTILGSSRGAQSVEEMVTWLVDHNVSMLFCAGGDGTQRGVHALADEIQKRGLHIAVVGIPKTVRKIVNVDICRDNQGYFRCGLIGWRVCIDAASQ